MLEIVVGIKSVKETSFGNSTYECSTILPYLSQKGKRKEFIVETIPIEDKSHLRKGQVNHAMPRRVDGAQQVRQSEIVAHVKGAR